MHYEKLAEDPVANFRTVGLAITLRCNFSCAHCINNSGPNESEVLDLSTAFDLIKDIAGDSHNICFTGGESMLEKSMLLDCIKFAKELGLTVSLVSNASWATTRDRAHSILRELADIGLTGICVSMDQFHLPFGKADNAIHAAEVCKELKLNHVIRVCSSKDDKFAEDFINRSRYPGIYFQRVPVLRMGRAGTLPVELFNARTELSNECCNTVLAPIVLPNGKVQACCGPGVEFNDTNPLNLGDWRKESLRSILRKARTNPLITALHNLGPKGILDLLKSNGLPNLMKKRATYSGICEICVDMCNKPDLVEAMWKMFDDPEIRMRLIAGQAYQQCYTYIEQLKYLDLPGFEQ